MCVQKTRARCTVVRVRAAECTVLAESFKLFQSSSLWKMWSLFRDYYYASQANTFVGKVGTTREFPLKRPPSPRRHNNNQHYRRRRGRRCHLRFFFISFPSVDRTTKNYDKEKKLIEMTLKATILQRAHFAFYCEVCRINCACNSCG